MDTASGGQPTPTSPCSTCPVAIGRAGKDGIVELYANNYVPYLVESMTYRDIGDANTDGAHWSPACPGTPTNVGPSESSPTNVGSALKASPASPTNVGSASPGSPANVGSPATKPADTDNKDEKTNAIGSDQRQAESPKVGSDQRRADAGVGSDQRRADTDAIDKTDTENKVSVKQRLALEAKTTRHLATHEPFNSECEVCMKSQKTRRQKRSKKNRKQPAVEVEKPKILVTR